MQLNEVHVKFKNELKIDKIRRNFSGGFLTLCRDRKKEVWIKTSKVCVFKRFIRDFY